MADDTTHPGEPDGHCAAVREAFSALLDGEPSPLARAEVDRHLSGCAACQRWSELAHDLTRRVRLTPAEDLDTRATATATATAAAIAVLRERRVRLRRTNHALRAGLAVVALAQLIIVIPALFAGQAGIGIPAHASRELGAFNLALAVGFAAAALRPASTRAMLPILDVATVLLIALSILDSAIALTTLAAETPHLIALTGILLGHLLTRTARTDPPAGGQTTPPRRRALTTRLRHLRGLGPTMLRRLPTPTAIPRRRHLAAHANTTTSR